MLFNSCSPDVKRLRYVKDLSEAQGRLRIQGDSVSMEVKFMSYIQRAYIAKNNTHRMVYVEWYALNGMRGMEVDP